MALTTPKMGLRLWDQLQDRYDHDQQADNWSKVDFHDHTPGRGVQIPTEGLATGAVTVAKLDPAVDPTGAYQAWRNVITMGIKDIAAAGAQTGLLKAEPYDDSALTSTASFFYVNPLAVTGKTIKYRILATVLTNAVAPAITFTAGLYSLTVNSGASGSGSTITANALQGTAVSIAAPGAGLLVPASGAEFTAPGAGVYGLAYTASGAVATGSRTTLVATLQARYV